MNKFILSLAILVFTTTVALANTPDYNDDSIIKFEQIDDKVVIEFLRDSDLLTKRAIRIFDERGREIFKSKARKYEKITEINMTNVKEGKYMILMVLQDKLVDIQFVKED